MQLILAAPGLLAQSSGALARASSLASLVALAPSPRPEPAGLAATLAHALGMPTDSASAPLAALGCGVDAGDDYIAHADPVLLAADRDDVVLVARVDDLAAADADVLATMLDCHFSDDGLRFVVARPDAWFVRHGRVPDLRTTPCDAARSHGIYDYLPRGADAGTWKRWQNEIGMLLHDHAINARRAAAGDSPVTGVWFWGGGRLGDLPTAPKIVAATVSGGPLADIARGIALHGGGGLHALAFGDAPADLVVRGQACGAAAVVVVAPVASDDDVPTLDRRWIGAALHLLARGRIATLTLLADGHGAVAWSATSPSLWQRIAAHARRRAFAVPDPAA